MKTSKICYTHVPASTLYVNGTDTEMADPTSVGMLRERLTLAVHPEVCGIRKRLRRLSNFGPEPITEREDDSVCIESGMSVVRRTIGKFFIVSFFDRF